MEPGYTPPPASPIVHEPVETVPHRLLIPVLIGLVVLLTGLTGLFAYQNERLRHDLALARMAIPTPPSLPTLDPITTPTASSSLKSYINVEFSFSFTYPKELSSTQGVVSGPHTGTSQFIQTFSDPTTVKDGTDAPFNGFSLYVVTNTKAANLEQFIANELAAMNEAEYSAMKGAQKQTLEKGTALINENRGYYYLPSEDKKTVVVFAYIQAHNSFRSTFEQAFTTFKFTQ